MCVIALKKRKVQIDFKTVELMFNHNPDGAGFALIENNKTTVSKGYFTVDSFWNDIKHLQDQRLILHFRIATCGGVNVPMCHPFIIDKDLDLVTSIYEETTKPVLFHNGMISHFGNTKMSDTCDFATNVLAYLPDTETQLNALKLADTKFIFIKEGAVYKIGQFYKYKGLSVSNDYFVPRATPPRGYKYANNHNSNSMRNRSYYSSGYDDNDTTTTDAIEHDEALNQIEAALQGTPISEADYIDSNYLEVDGVLVKRPQPIFDSVTGKYYEYDSDYDTYVECD